MDFFESEKNVNAYIKMTDKNAGKHLLSELQQHLSPGSTVLELGMGPGNDFKLLRQTYVCAGSDKSSVFVERFLKAEPGADILVLDALTIQTSRTFDCIFSNKVLIHLPKDELTASIERQSAVLNKNGIVFHTFWIGEKSETIQNLFFQYYSLKELKTLFEKHFQIIKSEIYTEIEKNDSCYLIGRIH